MNVATEDYLPSSEEVYQALLRSLRRRKGFGILFVQCSPAQGNQLIYQIKDDLPQKVIDVLQLTEPIDNLYALIAERPDRNELNILFIQGIEKSLEPYIEPGYGGDGSYYNLNTVPPLLSHLNQQRERFRDDFSKLCFVFIVPLFALKYFIRRAPDFFDWRAGLYFFPADSELVEQQSQQLLLDNDYSTYSQFTPRQRVEKLLDIQELLEEKHQTLDRKANLFFEQGRLLGLAREYEAAIGSYSQAIGTKEDYYQAWCGRGNALASLRRYEEAIDSYDHAIAVKENYYQAWGSRGIALASLRRYEEAIDSYDHAIAVKENDYQAWYGRGSALARLRRYEEAIDSYDRAIAVKENDYQAWYGRGSALARLRRYEEAIDSYDRAIAVKENDYQAWGNRGGALASLGRYEEAINSYDRAIAVKENDYQAWGNRGGALVSLGRYEEAINSYDRAIAVKENDYQAWYRRGEVLRIVKRYEEAVASYEKQLSSRKAWNSRGYVLRNESL